MNKLKELEQKYKELGEEIERLKNQGKVWKPEKGEDYMHLSSTGLLCRDSWGDYGEDEARYGIGNCFRTKEEAEAMAEKIKIYTQLKRLAEEINTEPIDWNNQHQNKYSFFYEEGMLEPFQQYLALRCKEMCVIFSTNRDFLKIAKERIGEENLLKLFKEWKNEKV